MKNKEYNAYVKSLCENENCDIQEIGSKAAQSAWYLESHFPCEDHSYSGFCSAYAANCGGDYSELCGEDDYSKTVAEGWITFHGGYAAMWADGIM